MTSTRTGWTIGGGVEWMFALHWSAFLEGNYIDFDYCLLRCMSPLMALSGQPNRTRVCPLLDQSGQLLILARDGLSAYDPKQTLAVHCGNGSDVVLMPVSAPIKVLV